GGTDAVELYRVAGEGEIASGGACFDEAVEGRVHEVLEGTATAANEVMVMFAGRKLIANGAVFDDDAAEDFGIHEEAHCPENGCAADIGQFGAEFLDGERPPCGGHGAEDAAAGSGDAPAFATEASGGTGGAGGSGCQVGRRSRLSRSWWIRIGDSHVTSVGNATAAVNDDWAAVGWAWR